ncbi:hypothetical protein Acr_28g0007810 [Actinidia rufa]|uniref:Uncharacterized protein n=1 Tax=Actinidia rufa TaxID=165716 RepID=A0A7J0HAH4_9ERIC|nr:hypothetical protein Acr_28g0007810 [Actinidia rufa]
MNCADDFLKFVSKWALENCLEDLKFLPKQVDRLQLMTSMSFLRISNAEAMEVSKQEREKAKLYPFMDCSYPVDEIYKMPVIIHNYPKELKPFYFLLNDDGKTVAALDIIVPKAGKLIRASENEECLRVLSTR